MHDIAVIGAGPIGLFAAGELAKRGYDVIVFEEHPDIGNPSHCSGLFSTHIFEIVGNKGIAHPVKRADIIAPSGEKLSIGDSTVRGYVVDRVEFDRAMARTAVREGAEIHVKERTRKIHKNEITTTLGEYRARVIIGADGVNSLVRKSMGIPGPKLMGAVQVIAEYESEEIERVKIWVGDSIAPGFFAWLIPISDTLVKVGLGARTRAWEHLTNLLKRLNLQPLSIHGGAIPITQVERTWDSSRIIVGDAAGQVKATSGGGVYPGLRSAECAVQSVHRFLSEGASLRAYEQCWRKSVGKELKIATYLHGLYTRMTDADFNALIHDLNNDDVIRIINKFGDIDYPSRVAWRIFRRKPGLLKYTHIAARQKKF
ncbi:MAG: NAD(P)/FAD-dependent oxidoreductase [Euryarchaeota archaeon]|nr:NAD(P)/FAD-dependent oxidoreductase [Euryarchaeota archaeon]